MLVESACCSTKRRSDSNTFFQDANSNEPDIGDPPCLVRGFSKATCKQPAGGREHKAPTRHSQAN